MADLVKKLFTGSPAKAEDGTRRFTISETTEDRDGTIVDASGALLENYKNNPVFLWAHDSTLPPIGISENVFVDGKQLKSDNRFSPADLDHPLGMGFGHTVERMYDIGIMRAVSIGFLIKEYSVTDRSGWMPLDVKEWELLEHSAVPVPAHPGALAEADAKGLDIAPMMQWAERGLDNECKLFVPRHTVEAFHRTADTKKKTYSLPPKVDDMTKEETAQAIKEAVEPLTQKLADAEEKAAKLEDLLQKQAVDAEKNAEQNEIKAFVKEAVKSAMSAGA